MFGLRHALRTLTKSPGPTFVVTSTLAIAIGATTIIASTIDGVWHAIPAIDTERLVFVASTDPRPSQAQSGMSGNLAMTGTSVPDLVDWTAHSHDNRAVRRFSLRHRNTDGTRSASSRLTRPHDGRDVHALGYLARDGRVFQTDDGRVGADAGGAPQPSVLARGVLV